VLQLNKTVTMGQSSRQVCQCKAISKHSC